MIPSKFYAGTTNIFFCEPSERPTSDGYAYAFKLGGATISLEKAGEIESEKVRFKLDPSDTDSFPAGFYAYQILATKDGDIFLVETGRVGVDSIISGTGAFDARSMAEKILDAIDAALLGRATSDQQSYMIQSGQSSRQLSRIPVTELRELRKDYARIVASERRAANSEGIFKQHKFAFTKP